MMMRIVNRLPNNNWTIAGVSRSWYSTFTTKSSFFERCVVGSKQYEVFCPNSRDIHQYDEETKRLVILEKPSTASKDDWQILPVDTNKLDRWIDAFETMLIYSRYKNVPLSDTSFDQFIDRFIEQLPLFSANNLLRALQLFAMAELADNLMIQRNYVELHRAFDRQSTIQLAQLNVKQCLYLCSIWLEIPYHKKTYFAVCISRLLNRRFSRMTSTELPLAAYYLTCLTRPIDEIREFEHIVDKNISQMTINDITMIAWAFERNSAKIENVKLRERLLTRLATFDSAHLNEAILQKLSPFLSKNVIQSNALLIRSILSDTHDNIEMRSLNECILLIQIGSSIALFDSVIMQHTFKLCMNDVAALNTLPMSALLNLSNSLCRFPNSTHTDQRTSVARIILNEVKNRLHNVADATFYIPMLHIIRNLTVLDVYDLELMENIFRPDFLQLIHKHDKRYNLVLYEIDGYNRINLKDIYGGQYLTLGCLEKVKSMTDFTPDREKRFHKRHRFLYAMEDAVAGIFSHYAYAHTLPYSKMADILVCLNIKILECIDISDKCLEKSAYPIEANRIADGDSDRILLTFVAATSNKYIEKGELRTHDSVHGYLKQKHQQLQLLGHHPIMVMIPDWNENCSHESITDFIVPKVNEILTNLGSKNKIPNRQ